MQYSISWQDYLIVVVYLSGIFILAYKSRRFSSGNNHVEDQYLAGKSLTIPESLFSIIATEVSALTFLGIPAIAYGRDYSFIQIYLGAVVGRFIIAKVMLIKMYDKGITVYSVMGKNGNSNGQRLTAIFYSINKVLAIGVRLFSGSILVAEFFNISIYTAILVICIITFFYTLIGGLKAVVRTDMVQMALFIFGGIAAHYLIPSISNHSWTELMTTAMSAGKTSFFDLSNMTPFILGIMGGILFDMATHGVDQDFAQRLTANRTLKGAQIAIVASSFFSIFIGLLFLSIGSLLWAHYQWAATPSIANDKIFAFFITSYFPIGLKGLMVAGVLAATMSTLDSTINALSSCMYNDILNNNKTPVEKLKSIYFRDSLIITLILLVVAFAASKSDGMLMLGLKIASWTAGSLLALFFATAITKHARLTTSSVIGAYIIGIGCVWLNTYMKWDWNLNVYFGFIGSYIFLFLFNKLNKNISSSTNRQ